MTPRSIRRAMERKAKKAALKAEKHVTHEPAEALKEIAAHAPTTQLATPRRPPVSKEAICWDPEPTDETPVEHTLFTSAPVSAAQLAANQSNAQLSTGPTSLAGKATSSLNAVKTALTGRTVLLPGDDASAYQQHLSAYADDLRPIGARECDLVQSIADSAWRLKRIPGLETAIFAQGHIEFAEAFNHHDPALRPSMIELQTFLKYEKQLRNLQLQESRLARRRQKELAELRQLQHERQEKARLAEREALETAGALYLAAQQANQPFNPAVNGFVFSTAEIEQHLQRVQARNMSRMTPSATPNRSAQAQKATQQAA